MALVVTKKNPTTDVSLVEKSKGDSGLVSEKDYNSTQETQKKSKKKGFLATTWQELTKVSWPKPGYIFKWSLIIILFTSLFSLVLGAFDQVFSNSISFVDCSSSKGRNQPLNDCWSEFVNRTLGR